MRRMSALTWLGMALSGLFVVLAIQKIDLAEFWAALRGARWGWIVPAMLLYFVGHVFRGLRSQLILGPHTSLGALRAMNLVLIGYAANNVLPARLGELIRTYVLGRLQSMSKATALSTIFVERVFDGMAIVAILFAVTYFSVPGATRLSIGQTELSIAWIAWTAATVFFGAFVCVLGVALLQRRFIVLSARLLSPFPAALSAKVLGVLERLMQGMDFLRAGWGVLAAILLLSACVWIAEGAMFWVTLLVFDLPPLAAAAYFATCITNLAIVIPASPGYVGTFHFFCALSLTVFGIPMSTGTAYAVVVHAVHYVPVTLWGIVALHHYGFGLGRVAREVEPEQS
jgi:glycosyltransferase 2 family protein